MQKRVRFFDQQYLVEQDFVDEQAYHLDRSRRLPRALCITGVIDGLVVTADGPSRLTITRGLAIDGQGRQLVLAGDISLPLAKFAGKERIRLDIGYYELAADRTTGGETGTEARWEERPVVTATLPDAPDSIAVGITHSSDGKTTQVEENIAEPDPSAIRLAEVSVDSQGSVSVNASWAKRAGMCLPGLVGIGTISPENAEGWNQVLDIEGEGASKLSIRTRYGELDTRVMAHAAGFWQAPAGMIIGTNSAHPVSIGTAATNRLTVHPEGNITIGTNDAQNHKVAISGSGDQLLLRREKEETTGGGRVFLTVLQKDNDTPVVPEVFPTIQFGHWKKFWNRIEAQSNGYHFKNSTPGENSYVDVRARRLHVHDRNSTDTRKPDDDGADTRWIGGDEQNGISLATDGKPRLTVKENGSVWIDGELNLNLYFDGMRQWVKVTHYKSGGVGYAKLEYTMSDGRLKTAVRPIVNALQKVTRLQGVHYRWNDAGIDYLTREIGAEFSAGPDATDSDTDHLRRAMRQAAADECTTENIGLVAQDVEAVVPELVSEDENGVKRLDYIHLSALLIEAIKEQQESIERLQRRPPEVTKQ
jgi:hypothetical protein